MVITFSVIFKYLNPVPLLLLKNRNTFAIAGGRHKFRCTPASHGGLDPGLQSGHCLFFWRKRRWKYKWNGGIMGSVKLQMRAIHNPYSISFRSAAPAPQAAVLGFQKPGRVHPHGHRLSQLA